MKKKKSEKERNSFKASVKAGALQAIFRFAKIWDGLDKLDPECKSPIRHELAMIQHYLSVEILEVPQTTTGKRE